MKIMLISLTFVCFFNALNAQIKVVANGFVGVGDFRFKSPDRILEVDGNASISCLPASSGLWFENYHNWWNGQFFDEPLLRGQWQNSVWIGTDATPIWRLYSNRLYSQDGLVHIFSDRKLKTNIRDLDASLEKIKQLRPVKFDLNLNLDNNISKEKADLIRKNSKDRIGFIAQEVKEIVPEVVDFEENSKLYTMDYGMLIPLLVNAIKEQQVIIEKLSSEITSIKDNCCTTGNVENKGLKKGLTSVESNSGSEDVIVPVLYQNNPNPFDVETEIKFIIPNLSKTAMLHVCNMQGTLLKSYTITERGTGSIRISGSEYNAGLYLYSLVVDGKLIDTKQMLLTN